MNKIAATNSILPRFRSQASRISGTLGLRLLLLLVVAELPLVAFVVLITLQNDRLRSGDALSRATSLQHSILLDVNRELRIAASLATASVALPASLLDSPDDCRAVLHTLIAPDADYIQRAALLAADGTQRCGSDPGPDRPLLPQAAAIALLRDPATIDLQVRNGAIEVTRRFMPGLPPSQAGAIVLRLHAPSPEDVGPDIPLPSIWLVYGSRWLPVVRAAVGEQPREPSRLLNGHVGPVRGLSQDGRAFLYTTTNVDDRLAATGATLVAASDIRAAARSTKGVFLFRLAEMAAFFLAEFILIVAGIDQVITRPLRQLSNSVRSWRQGGSFDPHGTPHDPIELRELTGSFAQATQALTQREQDLRSATARQELLMREIHHRVKNNLQIVASLLNLQASRIKVPEARAEFQSARDRVRALATLHRHLYGDGNLHMVDLRAFFAELCSQLFQAFGEAEGDRIQIRVTAPDINITSDQAVPIALIVTETVGNAIKYAFPGDRRGTITVSFLEGEADAGTLLVYDDGIGLADTPATGPREGLGMQLIRGFARQLGATLTVTHEAGTCYRVAMKLQRQSHADAAAALTQTIAA